MKGSVIKRIWLFYYEGFRSMTLGKTLWVIILIKLFIMFFVLKLFFFKDPLRDFKTEEEKSRHIINELTIKQK
ncbi:MAG: DUF4492 domain-containing protein [Bacteroidales bacterium]|nr:DUF4492 domain-containing protein [Bacteroidales bacterium]MDD2425417.1 DUF4492 domain-containing protein [Bacteroidales bacterium]MDD3988872.1 DUF4492 domain-containing protein [Bacteroidales bacterium]